jgi:rubredoxin
LGTIETIIPCTTPHSTSHKQELFLRTDTCTICGHVYNPEKGESLQDITPGIAFADLPADWTCPVCFASKNQFKKEE